MDKFWVSYKTTRDNLPKHFSDWDIDKHKIPLFIDQFEGWQLNIVKYLLFGDEDKKIPPCAHSAFSALSILVSYFENIARYIEGDMTDENVGKFFRKGCHYVYSKSYISMDQSKSNLLYKELRCGLHHIGLSKNKVILLEDPNHGLKFQDGNVFIAPTKFYSEVETHFKNYCINLQNDSKLRRNFERRFDWTKTN
jgi:hypothetical protein